MSLKHGTECLDFQERTKSNLIPHSKVHLIIESCKNAPTLSELYEKNCKTSSVKCYGNVKAQLKESETSFALNLSSLFIDNGTMASQMDMIFEAMTTVAKQQGALNNDYCLKLNHIDLASCLMTDQRASAFVERLLVECPNVTTLNLSYNLISSKTLKFLCDLTSPGNVSSKTGTLVSIYL